jgi:hypothetical protein
VVVSDNASSSKGPSELGIMLAWNDTVAVLTTMWRPVSRDSDSRQIFMSTFSCGSDD